MLLLAGCLSLDARECDPTCHTSPEACCDQPTQRDWTDEELARPEYQTVAPEPQAPSDPTTLGSCADVCPTEELTDWTDLQGHYLYSICLPSYQHCVKGA